MPSLVTERIESVKSGIVGAGALAIAELILVLLKVVLIDSLVANSITAITLDWRLCLHLAIAAVSGFLFGVTYRYIIRNDHNSHLNDGAVLAFGLVRGLALIEGNLIVSELLPLGILVMQSIIGFAIARSILDLAIKYKLVKPFI